MDLIQNEYVAYAPNTICSYSNLGINLLGNAVEQSSDTKYVKFIDENFFKPLNMKNSSIEEGYEGKSYKEGGEHKDHPLGMIPAGGLNTSVVDLSNIAIMINANGKFNGNSILESSSLKEMKTVQNEDVALDFGDKVGLGLFMSDKMLGGQDKIYHHGGDIGTHHSFFAMSKNSKLGVIVMSNSDEVSSWSITFEMMKKAYEERIGKKLPKEETLYKLEKASTLDGTYATTLGKVTFEKKEEGLYETKLMGKNIRLKLGEDNRYHAKYMLLGFIPIRVDELNLLGNNSPSPMGRNNMIE
jgi:CubicO group peptidase (beta-lactamase class C family)